MSSEAGGGLFALIMLIGLAGPIIAAAVTILVTGAAVAGAVALTVATARGVNKLIQNRHRNTVTASINQQQTTTTSNGANNLLAQQTAERRKQLLSVYETQSQNIDRATEMLQQQRTTLANDAKRVSAEQRSQLDALQRRASALRSDSNAAIVTSQQQLRTATNDKMKDLLADVTRQLTARRSQIDQALSRISDLTARNTAAAPYVTCMMEEVAPLYDQLCAEADLDTLLSGRRAVLARHRADCYDLLARKQYQAAIASVVSFSQHVSESWIELDAARHRRQLTVEQINLVAAELKAMVENCGTIKIEKMDKWPSDADYWAQGALAPVMATAKALLARVDTAATSVAATEQLLDEITHCTEEMRSVTNLSRQAYACSLMRMQMLKKSAAAFKANGWQSESWGYEGGDFRKPIVMRFTREGVAKADLVLAPVYDAARQAYDVRVTVERRDAGVIDEHLRQAQLQQLQNSLQSNGVPVHSLTCTHGTEGRNALGPMLPERFSVPESGASN